MAWLGLRSRRDCVLLTIMKMSWVVRKLGMLAMIASTSGLVATGGAAEEAPRPKPIQIRLVAEQDRVVPGKAFTVGLFLQHRPHHHSYYKFPGIVGVPTNVTWALPEGFEAGALQWPTPEQVDMRGHGAYGYHEDTLLLATIQAPSVLSSETVTLKGRVGYMCCSQEWCTPGFEDVSLTLPVGVVGEAKADEEWAATFAETRKLLPQALTGWSAEVEDLGERFQLVVTPPQALEKGPLPKAEALYFFSWNGWTASDKPHAVERDARGYVFIMPKHPFPDEGATRFQGVVRSESGWPGLEKPGLGLWIDLPMRSAGAGEKG